jgi:hypothetical protein
VANKKRKHLSVAVEILKYIIDLVLKSMNISSAPSSTDIYVQFSTILKYNHPVQCISTWKMGYHPLSISKMHPIYLPYCGEIPSGVFAYHYEC